MYFPSVPDVLGIPPMPRIPAVAIQLVSGNLDMATDIMASIGVAAITTPTLPMGGFLPDVQTASSLIGAVQNTFTTYPSSLFDPFGGPVSDISSSLTSITNSINATPSAPIGNLAGQVDNSAELMGNVADDFAADAGINDATLDDSVESVTSTAIKGQPEWGIFLSGASVVKADNVVGFEFKKDWTISDYPVEQGAFQSYDKVELPFDARVRFSCGGSIDARTGFLKSISDIAGDLKLYDVVTPTKTYQSCNVTRYDYRQTAQNGVGLMVVEVYLEEVRDTATASFSQATGGPDSPPAPTKTPAPKSPSAQPQKSGGTKQSQPIPIGQGTSFTDAMSNALLGG